MRTQRFTPSMRSLLSAALLLCGLCVLPGAGRAQVPGVPDAGVQPRNVARNVRLTFHLVQADGFEGVDPEISDVVDELRQLFRFNGYRLLDTSVLTGVVLPRETDRVSQRLVFPELGTLEIEAFIDDSGDPTAVRVGVHLRDANQDVVTLERRVRGPDIMSVSVNVRDGQTVVLGSGRPEGSEAALILVMSADMDP